MTRFGLIVAGCMAMVPVVGLAQDGEGLVTQILVRAESKGDVMPDAASVKLQVEGRTVRVMSLTPVAPARVQVALLIDEGLSRSAGIQLEDLKKFTGMLPADVELLVGYMSNGSVRTEAPFSTDHAAAAKAIRLPMGAVGQSASPYFCLSDFVKNWPVAESGQAKARVVMMITNGVDPYNGSTGISNQNSPYVAASVTDAQRAGVAVSSIYYRDAGYGGGGSAAFSGQGYLQQVAEGTGGESFYEGSGSPVSLAPFLKQFVHAIAETYVATFRTDAQGGGRDHLVRVKIGTSTPKLKLRTAEMVRPGNREGGR